MRSVPLLVLLVALTASAAAQSDDSVTVNPAGSQVLIDPGTGQQRVIPALLQPWQAEPIKLHPPGKHRHSSSQSATSSVASAPAATAPVVRAPKPKPAPKVASVPPPQPASPPAAQNNQVGAPSGSLDIDSFLNRSQSNVLSTTTQPTSPPPRKAANIPAPKPAPVEMPRKSETRTAMIQRPAAHPPTGTRKDTITFAPNATDPSTSAVSAVRTLAGSLNAALANASSRVQLLAYGGAKGEKSSDTRRLSLKRALVVRQLLIDDGVPSERIDVFALGGVEDNGPLDRVDVYVKS